MYGVWFNCVWCNKIWCVLLWCLLNGIKNGEHLEIRFVLLGMVWPKDLKQLKIGRNCTSFIFYFNNKSSIYSLIFLISSHLAKSNFNVHVENKYVEYCTEQATTMYYDKTFFMCNTSWIFWIKSFNFWNDSENFHLKKYPARLCFT